MARKPDMIVLHTGTNDLKNNKTPSDITSEIIQLAKSIKTNGIKVAISSMNIYLQEKRCAENFAIIYHTNINSKQDLFPDKLHPNKKGRGILKGNFEMFINNCKF